MRGTAWTEVDEDARPEPPALRWGEADGERVGPEESREAGGLRTHADALTLFPWRRGPRSLPTARPLEAGVSPDCSGQENIEKVTREAGSFDFLFQSPLV